MAIVPDSRLFRLICLAGAIFLIVSLFWAGAKPIAVGLFPGQVDKVAHFAVFGLIAALMWLSFKRGRPLVVIAIVSATGAADEFHQHFLPGRSASIEDLLADILSAIVIVILMKYARQYDK